MSVAAIDLAFRGVAVEIRYSATYSDGIRIPILDVLCRMPTVAAGKSVAAMSAEEKIEEAMRRSLALLPADVQAEVERMLEPTSLAIIAGTLVVWAGSHFFGVGEIVDVLLLVVGSVFLGWAAWDAAQELMNFGKTAVYAKSEADLDRAAQSFARAVTIIGINTVMAILFHKAGKAVKSRGSIRVEPGLAEVGSPGAKTGSPPLWEKITVTVDPGLPAGEGFTTAFGDVTVSSLGSTAEQSLVRFHELVHSFLSPKFRPLRQFRARFGQSAYNRSAFLKYVEEAMAETYAQLRVNGMSSLPTGIKFPVANGYVTISQLYTEGAAIGSITLGTKLFIIKFVASDDPKNRSK